MSNATTMAATRRKRERQSPPWLRTAWALIVACAMMMALTGLAKAAVSLKSPGCEALNSAVIDLIPAVNFTIGALHAPGVEIYRTKTYVIDYECYVSDRFGNATNGTPQLQTYAGFAPLNAALEKGGLKLQIIVNGDEAHPWTPNRIPEGLGVGTENFSLEPSYLGWSGRRQVTLVAKLIIVDPNPAPGRYVISPANIFKIINSPFGGLAPGPFIATTSTRMQFTPACIGDVSVDNLVRFNNVIATGGYMGTLPQQQLFKVTAGLNRSCPRGVLTFPQIPDNENTRFLMLLSAQFVLQGPGRIGSDGASIILSNDDGVENGLKMQILDTNNANQPVPILSAPAPMQRSDVGNFGMLAGDNPAAVVHTYAASLTADPGKDLKIGKYSTQVLVRVSYY